MACDLQDPKDYFDDLFNDTLPDNMADSKFLFQNSPDSGHDSPRSISSPESTLSKDFSWESTEDFWNSLLDDFVSSPSSECRSDQAGNTSLDWKDEDQIMDTDDLLPTLSSDENDLVDNITVDIGWNMDDAGNPKHFYDNCETEAKNLVKDTNCILPLKSKESVQETKNVKPLIVNTSSHITIATGNNGVPIKGILLKPVNCAGTTTLISVPVSLMSTKVNTQTVQETPSKSPEAEKPHLINVDNSLNATKGVSKGCGPGLMLTDEERQLLDVEGVSLPTDTHLTKAEEKMLKKVRRKIKNKQSAMESRRRRKDYIDNLEKRVRQCTDMNFGLKKQVTALADENKSLLEQLKSLKNLVAKQSKSVQTGTCLAVLLLSFALFTLPLNNLNMKMGEQRAGLPAAVDPYASNVVRSRTLLQYDEAVDHDHHEEGNASDIMLSKLSSLKIQDEDIKKNLIDVQSDTDKMSNFVGHEKYQSVIEIDKNDFSNKWRTSYSDEM